MNIKILKDKILQLAIQGKLVEQNPNDESASVLLERIKAEKEQLIKEKKIKKERPLREISEEEKCFEIPNSWEWVRIGDVVQLNPRNSVDDDLDTSFVPMKYIEEGYSNRHETELKKWKDIKSGFTHFQEGDVVIAKINPCFQNRKSAIMKNLINHVGAGTTELYVLRAYSNYVLNKFLLYLIKGNDFIDGGVKSYTGTAGQQRVKKEFVQNYVFPLPPLEEQKRIVEKVDELFKLIDELNNNKEYLLQDIENTKNKVLRLAIQGKLVEQNPNDESASVLLEKIKVQKEQLIKEKQIKKEKPLPEINQEEKVFEIPDTWKWCRLGEISTVKGGKRVPAGYKLLNTPTDYLYIRVADMKNGTILENDIKYISREIYEKIKNYYIETEDIYMTIAGTIGRVGTVPNKFNRANLTENASKIRCYYVEKDYIFRVLNSDFIQKQIADKTKKVGQPKLALNQIESLVLPLPPLEEQKRIVAKVNIIMKYMDEINDIVNDDNLITEIIKAKDIELDKEIITN